MPLYRGSRRLILRRNVPAAVVGGASLAQIGTGVTDGGNPGGTVTLTGDIGTATATRVILIAATRQNGSFSGVTVNGQAASSVQASASGFSQFWALVGAAAGSGSQSIVATGGAFEFRALRAWVMDGLGSTTKVQSSTSTTAIGSISLLAGDYWFANGFTSNTARNWSGSTPVPTNDYNDNAGNGSTAQWTIASNVTGTALMSGGSAEITQIQYR